MSKRKPGIAKTRGRSARLWFRLPLGPNHWAVYLADVSECSELAGNEGVAVHRESAIYLDDGLEASRLVAVLGHELVHACFTNCNLEAEASLYGCEEDAETVRKAQERIAVYLGPQLIDGLQRAGMLTLPKVPE